MTPCRLTVLMAVYNGGAFLRTAIDSILQQTYTNFHFLIVDDASTDDTRETVRSYPDETIESFRKFAAINVEALNHATANIPADRMRMHICWGNYPGPHHHDVPLEEILGIVLKARPAALLLEGANPRHEHEWEVFKSIPLPDDKVLIPGVIDSTSNYIEHPKLIAQRLCRYAEVVGKERVMAGSDCGFSTFAGVPQVFPSIVWAKFEAMVEGARFPSHELWP